MTYHTHLLIETPDANLSVGLRHLYDVYTQTISQSHYRVGYLFQGRCEAGTMLSRAIDNLSSRTLTHRVPKPLLEYDKESKNQNAAVFHAYFSRGYEQQEIAYYYGVHYTTVSRTTKRIESR